MCPDCSYGCLAGRNGSCALGCRDGFRERPALAAPGRCAPNAAAAAPHHSADCAPLLGFQPCWGGNAGGVACVPEAKGPCPSAPNASYQGMAVRCEAAACPAPSLDASLAVRSGCHEVRSQPPARARNGRVTAA